MIEGGNGIDGLMHISRRHQSENRTSTCVIDNVCELVIYCQGPIKHVIPKCCTTRVIDWKEGRCRYARVEEGVVAWLGNSDEVGRVDIAER